MMMNVIDQWGWMGGGINKEGVKRKKLIYLFIF